MEMLIAYSVIAGSIVLSVIFVVLVFKAKKIWKTYEAKIDAYH